MQTPIELLVQAVLPAILAIGIVPRILKSTEGSRRRGLAMVFAVCAMLNFLIYGSRFDLDEKLLRATAMGVLPIVVGWIVWHVAWKRR